MSNRCSRCSNFFISNDKRVVTSEGTFVHEACPGPGSQAVKRPSAVLAFAETLDATNTPVSNRRHSTAGVEVSPLAGGAMCGICKASRDLVPLSSCKGFCKACVSRHIRSQMSDASQLRCPCGLHHLNYRDLSMCLDQRELEALNERSREDAMLQQGRKAVACPECGTREFVLNEDETYVCRNNCELRGVPICVEHNSPHKLPVVEGVMRFDLPRRCVLCEGGSKPQATFARDSSKSGSSNQRSGSSGPMEVKPSAPVPAPAAPSVSKVSTFMQQNRPTAVVTNNGTHGGQALPETSPVSKPVTGSNGSIEGFCSSGPTTGESAAATKSSNVVKQPVATVPTEISRNNPNNLVTAAPVSKGTSFVQQTKPTTTVESRSGAPAASGGAMCGICKASRDLVPLSSCKGFCKACVSRHIRSQMSDAYVSQLRCPCGLHHLNYRDLRACLDQRELEALNERSREAAMLQQGRKAVACPECGTREFVLNEDETYVCRNNCELRGVPICVEHNSPHKLPVVEGVMRFDLPRRCVLCEGGSKSQATFARDSSKSGSSNQGVPRSGPSGSSGPMEVKPSAPVGAPVAAPAAPSVSKVASFMQQNRPTAVVTNIGANGGQVLPEPSPVSNPVPREFAVKAESNSSNRSIECSRSSGPATVEPAAVAAEITNKVSTAVKPCDSVAADVSTRSVSTETKPSAPATAPMSKVALFMQQNRPAAVVTNNGTNGGQALPEPSPVSKPVARECDSFNESIDSKNCNDEAIVRENLAIQPYEMRAHYSESPFREISEISARDINSVSAESDEGTVIEHVLSLLNESFLDSCLECGVPLGKLVMPTDSFSQNCPSCSEVFCGCCKEWTSKNWHSHIRNCPRRPPSGSYAFVYNEDEWNGLTTARKWRAVDEVLSSAFNLTEQDRHVVLEIMRERIGR